jgi:D-methionine transport system permease protein
MNPEDIELAWKLLPLQTWNTLYMVLASTLFSFLLGIPLGIVLTLTDKGHLHSRPPLYHFLATLVNIGRSFPFSILMVSLIPFNRWIVGTSLGTTASIVPLTVAAFPFVAKLVENNLKEISKGSLEAAVVMGATTWHIVKKVLLPEAFPSLISSITLTIVNLVGYSAMAGMVGGGGLGQVAIQYGYNRFNPFIMGVTVVLLIILVQIIQAAGYFLHQALLNKRGLL